MIEESYLRCAEGEGAMEYTQHEGRGVRFGEDAEEGQGKEGR